MEVPVRDGRRYRRERPDWLFLQARRTSPRGRSKASRRCAGHLGIAYSPAIANEVSRTTSPGNPVDAPGVWRRRCCGQPAGDGQLASARGPGDVHAAKLRRGRVIRLLHRRRMAGVRRSAPPEGEMDPTEVRRRATAGALPDRRPHGDNADVSPLPATSCSPACSCRTTSARWRSGRRSSRSGRPSSRTGGMGVALIRRRDDPKPDDLRALLGFQLATSSALAAVAVVVGSVFGLVGLVTRGDGPLHSRSWLRARRRRSCSSAACADPAHRPRQNSWRGRWSTTRGRSRSSSLDPAYGGSRPGRSSAAPWPPCCSSASPLPAGSGSGSTSAGCVRCSDSARDASRPGAWWRSSASQGLNLGIRRGGRDLRARAVGRWRHV